MTGSAPLSVAALETAFVNAPIAIGVCDEDGRFVAASHSLVRLLKRPADRIVGRPFLAFLHPDDRAEGLAAYFEAVVATAAGVRTGARALHCVTGTGERIPVLARWTVTGPDADGAEFTIVYLSVLGPQPVVDASDTKAPATASADPRHAAPA